MLFNFRYIKIVLEFKISKQIIYFYIESHESTVWSSDFNKDGNKLISASDDKTLKLWKQTDPNNDDSKWTCYCTVSGYHSRAVFSVKWSKLNNLIVTSSADNSIHIFKENANLENDTGNQMVSLLCQYSNAHEQDVNCVDWSPNVDGLLASCSDDGTIKIWQFNNIQD